ncbi:MAG: TraR/DksA family transcriptional regulator [Burkholderiaceae bacterium]
MTPSSTTPIEAVAAQLLARRQVILSDIRTHLHSSDDSSKLALMNHLEEVGDWAEADLLNDTDIAQLGNELNALRDVDAALLRIKSGTYGICIDCGEAIPANRLLAQMTAQRCIACQTNADKRHGLSRKNSI